MQEWLVNLPDLEGLWGMERFGLADIRVSKALEGLEGADECTLYKFVEERSTWAAEKARLDKLVQSRSKQVRVMSQALLAFVGSPDNFRTDSARLTVHQACTWKTAASAAEGYARRGRRHSYRAYRQARVEPRRRPGS